MASCSPKIVCKPNCENVCNLRSGISVVVLEWSYLLRTYVHRIKCACIYIYTYSAGHCNCNTPIYVYSRSLRMFNALKPQSNGPSYCNTAIGIHWPSMGGLLHLVQRGGDWAGPQPAQAPPRCTICNSAPINVKCTNFVLFDVACIWTNCDWYFVVFSYITPWRLSPDICTS